MEIKRNIQIVTNTEITNQAQRDMIKKFGIFVTYFLFMFPKYDKWYQDRIKLIKTKLSEVQSR